MLYIKMFMLCVCVCVCALLWARRSVYIQWVCVPPPLSSTTHHDAVVHPLLVDCASLGSLQEPRGSAPRPAPLLSNSLPATLTPQPPIQLYSSLNDPDPDPDSDTTKKKALKPFSSRGRPFIRASGTSADPSQIPHADPSCRGLNSLIPSLILEYIHS